jgi:hypothetical protein
MARPLLKAIPVFRFAFLPSAGMARGQSGKVLETRCLPSVASTKVSRVTGSVWFPEPPFSPLGSAETPHEGTKERDSRKGRFSGNA